MGAERERLRDGERLRAEFGAAMLRARELVAITRELLAVMAELLEERQARSTRPPRRPSRF